MTRAAVLILALLSVPAHAVERDKALHFGAALAITAVTYAITDDAKLAIYAGIGASVAKELYDSRNGGTGFDTRDLTAGAIGAAFGISVRWRF